MNPPSPPRHRQGALWPWLVTPLVTLVLFYVLHNERRATPQTRGPPSPDAIAPAGAHTGAVNGL